MAKVVQPGRSKGTAQLWFFIPDIHFPDHHNPALEVVLKTHELLAPEHTVLLGDVIDAASFSAHPRKSLAEIEAYDFKEREIDPCNEFLDKLQVNTRQLYYIEGNHEFFVERWATRADQAARSIYTMINPKSVFSKGRQNFKWIAYPGKSDPFGGYLQVVPNHVKMKTGGLVAIHGFSYAKQAAQVHLDLSRSQSIIYGHTHRAQAASTRDPWTNKVIKAWSPGTLSKLQPFYRHGVPTDWSHGFSLVYVGQTSWTEYSINIVNDCCVLPDGREIRI